MSRSIQALMLLSVVAIVGLFTWGVMQESPEPERLPAPSDAEPVEVNVQLHLDTPTPEPTLRPIVPTPTPTLTYAESLPNCRDAKGGAVCLMVEPPIVPEPTAYLTCDSSFIVSAPSDAVPCMKPTDVPTPGGFFP